MNDYQKPITKTDIILLRRECRERTDMYQYEISHGYVIIQIAGKRYLLDTGSPISFWIANPQASLAIDGIEYPLHPTPANYDVKQAEKTIGAKVDGFVGLDIIKKTSLTIYKNAQRVAFEACAEEGEEIPLGETRGFLSVQGSCLEHRGTILLDTGAPNAYGEERLFKGNRYIRSRWPYGSVEEYSPSFGNLRSDYHYFESRIGKKEVEISICKNYRVMDVLQSMQVMMIASIMPYFEEVCVIDIAKSKLVLR